jgi:hypothetical protein
MEIDGLVKQFRLASRELFNHYFRTAALEDSETYERFLFVQETLFEQMVTTVADLPKGFYGQLQPDVLVKVRPPAEFAPLMLNRQVDSGYWDHPQREFTKEVTFHFIEFFDWDQSVFWDHQYVRAKVAAWPSNPELVGKLALIESQYVCFAKAEAR